jgi:isocitrate lyase
MQKTKKVLRAERLVARNANGRVWQRLSGGSLESGSHFCVGASGGNLASVAMKMSSNLIYLEVFYIFITVCKDIAAVNLLLFNIKTIPQHQI